MKFSPGLTNFDTSRTVESRPPATHPEAPVTIEVDALNETVIGD